MGFYLNIRQGFLTFKLLYLLCHPQILLLHALLDFQVLPPFSGISLTNHHKAFLSLEGTRMSGVAEYHPFSSRAQAATFAKLETWGTQH